ncbi:GreA/GreB family elongation factor [Rudanella lutea]|jgi:transcription elongation factor GreB|uniref:GreA/GreB family elongation factor n=1 Tax=Rudanella lutea TaxID=451374 RepID=UPI00035CDF12|nr:GreA/GreB family elongation factor [Rudanella lutea]
MSRAFLKNETADDPVVIPARAPLPPGVTNYVTPRGLSLLRTELADLEAERLRLQTDEPDETERTRQLALTNGKIAALNSRIASATVVHPHDHVDDPVVRFGATVTLTSRTGSATTRQLTIVGVDEADATQGRIAFTAPLARSMQGKRVGDTITLRSPRGNEEFEIQSLSFTA